MRQAKDKQTWKCIEEAYIQEWTIAVEEKVNDPGTDAWNKFNNYACI